MTGAGAPPGPAAAGAGGPAAAGGRGAAALPRQVVERLRCPLCGAPPAPAGTAVRCPSGHAFDIARQGYVNLLTGGRAPGTADTAEMVAQREAFLSADHYGPLTRALAERSAAAAPGASFVVDAGAGTGHYLRAVLERWDGADEGGQPYGLALDVSKFALRRAARAHPRIGAAVWDVWRPLPVATGCADVVLNVFAPRNAAEFRRVLRPDGVLLVAAPTGDHLRELVEPLGLLSVDPRKEQRLREALGPHFRREGERRIEFPLRLPPAQAAALVRMGPSAHHVDAESAARRLAAREDGDGRGIAVTASVVLAAYRPLPHG